MKNAIKYGLLILALPAVALLQSCEDGTMEEAGEDLDRLAGDAANETEDAAREAGNRIEDACEDLTENNC